jgi:deoxyribonuclease-4
MVGIHVNLLEFKDIEEFNEYININKIDTIAFILSYNILKKYKYFIKIKENINIFPHASLYINLASNNNKIQNNSINQIINEANIITHIGLKYIVVHPGSTLKKCTIFEALKILANSLEIILTNNININILLENMCGSGGQICCNIEEFNILKKLLNPKFFSRIGICFDTCHAFAFGHKIDILENFVTLFDELNNIFEIKLIHLNDSKGKLGSKIDRHMNWGNGELTKLNFLTNCIPLLKKKKIQIVL